MPISQPIQPTHPAPAIETTATAVYLGHQAKPQLSFVDDVLVPFSAIIALAVVAALYPYPNKRRRR